MISEISPNQISDNSLRDNAPRRRTVIRAPSVSLAGLTNDLYKLVEYKDLLIELSIHRVKVRYKQSALGVSWAILQPLALMLIYTAIFSFIARMPSDGTPYAIFAYSALLPWIFFSTALSNASNSLVSHASLVTKVYFPREILPLTYVAAAFFDFLVASLALAALLIYYRVTITLNVIYVLPIMFILALLATAVAFFSSATQVRFRDIGVAMPLLLQIWMFATPVVYPLSAVPAGLRPFYQLNPLVGVIENFRRVVLQGTSPDLSSLGVSAVVSLLLFAAGYVYFKRVEATLADLI